MQFINFTSLLIIPALVALVAGNACVSSGPVEEVNRAANCCKVSHGKWFQNYPNQAICVLTAGEQSNYKGCVESSCPNVGPQTCIVCDEKTDCGLTK